jgi:hypothetical protein
LTQRHTPSDLIQLDALRVRANLQTNGDEKGFSFRSTPTSRWIGPPNYISLQSVFIGAAERIHRAIVHARRRIPPRSNGVHQPGVDYGSTSGAIP